MKLFLINFDVTFGKGKSSLKLSDEMLVPGANEAEARSLFASTMEKAGTLLMNQNVAPDLFTKNTGSSTSRVIRAIVPINQFNGKVTITSCVKL